MTISSKKRSRGRPVHKASRLVPKTPPLTISRPEMLIAGSDHHFRRLVHGLFGFFARHETVRSGHAARIGLLGIEYTVLISIRHLATQEGDVNVSRIAEHLYLSGAFVTTVANKLLQRGLIRKTLDLKDRRRVKLDVSKLGDALLAELAPVQRQVNDVQFGCLTNHEFLQLLDMIERLIHSSDSAVRLQEYLADYSKPKVVSYSGANPGKTRTRHKARFISKDRSDHSGAD